MREFKFRAWHKQAKRMFPIKGMNFARQVVVLWGGEEMEHVPMPLVEVMQYTGKKDQNGGEIFEQDILEGQNSGENISGVVAYDSEKAAFVLVNGDGTVLCDLNELASGKILGNSFETS